MRDWITHCWQKLTRGFCDCELYNLDVTIAEFIIPRLEAYRDLDIDDELKADIDKILWSLWDCTGDGLESEKDGYKRCQEGLDLLAKRFLQLWS